METIYLSLRAQVAVGTFFMKSPVPKFRYLISYFIFVMSLLFISVDSVREDTHKKVFL